MSGNPQSAVGSGHQPRRARTRSHPELAASPTLRRRRIARALHQLREAKGLTAKQAAAEAKKRSPERAWSETKVTRIEARKIRRPRDIDVQTLLDVYDVTDHDTREAYRKLAREASQTGWWVGYKDVLNTGVYVDLETEASRIRTYQALVVPGLLQTEDYARAVIRGGGITNDEEVERRVEARMLRQQILQRSDAPRLWAILDESVLRKIPRDTGQLEHLISVQRPDLRIQVLPDAVGPHAAAAGPFTMLDFPDDPPIVYLEQSMSGLLLEEPEELDHYTAVYDYVQATALSVDASRQFIEALIE